MITVEFVDPEGYHLSEANVFARIWYAHGSGNAIQATLNEPAKWAITVVGAEDRPFAGLRLTPHLFRRNDRHATLIDRGSGGPKSWAHLANAAGRGFGGTWEPNASTTYFRNSIS
jgi:hypothetical protein